MKYVHELSEAEQKRIENALRRWKKAKEVRRVRAIRLSGKGWSVPDIAEALDMTPVTIRKWIDWYEEDGLEGLRTAPRSGRPPKADEDYRKLLAQVVQTPPREMGYPFNRWTLEHLARHMEQQTGVSLNHRYLSELLHKMGFTYKRPRHDLSHRRDSELYERKKKELETLKKRAMSPQKDFELLFADESEAHSHPPLTKVWARVGEPARVPAAGNDEKVTVFGAWNFRTQRFSWHLCERKNSEEFLTFLRQLLEGKPPEKRYILVLDNAGYHRANKVQEFLEQHEGQIEPFWLPPYSPELNLIEYVWGYLKEHVTNNYFFGEINLLIEALIAACRELASPGRKLLSVNFKTQRYLPEAA